MRDAVAKAARVAEAESALGCAGAALDAREAAVSTAEGDAAAHAAQVASEAHQLRQERAALQAERSRLAQQRRRVLRGAASGEDVWRVMAAMMMAVMAMGLMCVVAVPVSVQSSDVSPVPYGGVLDDDSHMYAGVHGSRVASRRIVGVNRLVARSMIAMR